MDFTKGEDRILFVRINGVFLPIGCLTDNSMEESSEFIDTTTRDNKGWNTSRPLNQSYSLSFSGLQVNTTVTGGTFSIASYDKLKELKRDRELLDWKIQGTVYPIVDYGMCYISSLSEANPVGEFITFTGAMAGFSHPKMATLALVLANGGDTTLILNTGNTVINQSEVFDFNQQDFNANDFT